MRRNTITAVAAVCIVWCATVVTVAGGESHPILPKDYVVLNDDGGWCWFQDERAIVRDGKLMIGTVAAGRHDPTRKGSIEVVAFDLGKRAASHTVLHERLQCDDHNSPALLALNDGQILAMYSQHGNENRIYYRRGQPTTESLQWGPERVFVPSDRSRVTYTNLFSLTDENQREGKLYNFYRGYDDSFKPSWITSDDDGMTWSAHGLWIDYPAKRRHRPYVKYASNNRDTIHVVFTEGHPRDFNNSVFHAYYRNGAFHRSNGAKIKDLVDGPVVPREATCVFAGDEDNVAWTADLHLDSQQRPVVVYSVQKNSAVRIDGDVGRRDSQTGLDHRYRYARWDGVRWHDHEIAYGGTRLYPGEDDYTGGICLNPDDPNEVYLSSDVNVLNGSSNKSGHYEIHKGVTKDFGRTWTWTEITKDSTADNIRPIVPNWSQRHTAVLWLRGKYTSYTDFDLDVVGVIPGT